MALEIKRLVHGEGYTLSGARHALGAVRRAEQQIAPPARSRRTSQAPRPKLPPSSALHAPNLREIAGLLASPEPQTPRRRPRMTSLHASTESLFPS